jgi:hypothetical protein
MSKKLLVLILTALMVTVLCGQSYADAFARWAGGFAGTRAATNVPGATTGKSVPPWICIDQHVYPAEPLPIRSYCWALRTPPTAGGAYAYAECNLVGQTRIARAWSFTWGPRTWAGKAIGDTTRCSTSVEITTNAGSFDLNVYGYFKSPKETGRRATADLKIVAGGETLFTGSIDFRGDATATTVNGRFDEAGVVYGEGTATFQHNFTNVSYGSHDPNSAEIIITSDVQEFGPIPSMTTYGIIGLVVLLCITGWYFYRRRRVARSAA